MLAILLALALTSNEVMEWPDAHNRPEPVRCSADSLESARTVLGLRARRSELDRAEHVLGSANRRTEGEGGEWKAWRCWEAANGDGTVLQIGRSDVDAFIRVYGREIAFAGRGKCAKSSLVHLGIASGGGLRVGQPHEEAATALHVSVSSSAKALHKTCYAQRPLSAEERSKVGHGVEAMDITAGFTVVLVGGHTAEFEIRWTETY